jgi:hypothetical protein
LTPNQVGLWHVLRIAGTRAPLVDYGQDIRARIARLAFARALLARTDEVVE